jgi:dolichyl-phosphate beta-glucosyltransferase
LYLALVFWSPAPIITRESEKEYRSHVSPNKPLPLARLSDPSSVDLTIVVPAYNETERLPVMMTSTIQHLTSPTVPGKRRFEILIVDDGSTDGTSATAIKLAAQYPKCDIRVVTLEKNVGKGGAVRHGMLYASGERLLMADADGASRIEDLELLWKAMDTLVPDNGPAIVVGSRAHLVKSEAVVKVRRSKPLLTRFKR